MVDRFLHTEEVTGSSPVAPIGFPMRVEIIKKKASKELIKSLAEATFGGMIKLAVDIEREILAAGGEFHADGEHLLLKDGSKQENIWGANYYPFEKPQQRIQFSALINVRPQLGNRTMNIEDDEVRQKVKTIIEKLLMGPEDAIS